MTYVVKSNGKCKVVQGRIGCLLMNHASGLLGEYQADIHMCMTSCQRFKMFNKQLLSWPFALSIDDHRSFIPICTDLSMSVAGTEC